MWSTVGHEAALYIKEGKRKFRGWSAHDGALLKIGAHAALSRHHDGYAWIWWSGVACKGLVRGCIQVELVDQSLAVPQWRSIEFDK